MLNLQNEDDFYNFSSNEKWAYITLHNITIDELKKRHRKKSKTSIYLVLRNDPCMKKLARIISKSLYVREQKELQLIK